MSRLLPLLLVVLTVLLRTSPAWAIERLAVLELTGKSLGAEERGLLTDSVRGAIVKVLGGGVVVMTRENMEVMLTDMGMDATCVSEGACEVETARNLGVDYVISGSVVSVEGTYIVSLKLHETRSGQLVASEQARGAGVLALLDGITEPSKALVASLGGMATVVPNLPATGAPAPRVPTTAAAQPAVFDRPANWVDDDLQRAAEQKRLQSIGLLKSLAQQSGVKGATQAEMSLRLGDLYYEQGRYRLLLGDQAGLQWLEQASSEYSGILSGHATFARTDEALYYKAMSEAHLGRWDAARGLFQDLLTRFPESAYHDDAVAKLAKLP